jgi:acyl-CoA reductase-like NAD-dependent aldehyde dehydrogenase
MKVARATIFGPMLSVIPVAGLVYVNCCDHDDMITPFGGLKQTGVGRYKSPHELDKYTESKATWISLARLARIEPSAAALLEEGLDPVGDRR